MSSPPIAISASTPSCVQVLRDPLDAAVDLERVGPRRAEDGAAARQDAAHLGDARAASCSALERAPPAVAEADELVAVDADALADDGPDHRVQPGAVAATGQHSDTHDALRSSPLVGSAVDGCQAPAGHRGSRCRRASGPGCAGRRRARRAGRRRRAAAAARPASSQRCRSSWVNRGIARGSARMSPHSWPARRGRRPAIQAHSSIGSPGRGEEGEQVVADRAPASARPGRPATAACRARCARTQSIARVGVELGRDGVELAAVLVDDADRDEVDRAAVLDELAVVEEAHWRSVSEARVSRHPVAELAHPGLAALARAEARCRLPLRRLHLGGVHVDVLLAGQLHQLVHDLVGHRPLDEPVAGHALVAGEVERLADPHARARPQLRDDAGRSAGSCRC